MKTIYQKLQRGGYEAKTVAVLFDLGDKARVLEITTTKWSKGITTNANSMLYDKADRYSTWDVFGDFSKRLAVNPARGTEQAIRKQHDAMIAQHAESLIAEAKAFYEAKGIKKAA